MTGVILYKTDTICKKVSLNLKKVSFNLKKVSFDAFFFFTIIRLQDPKKRLKRVLKKEREQKLWISP